jgi:dTDP-4-amino-4,6-dideoxygalactose transaminase
MNVKFYNLAIQNDLVRNGVLEGWNSVMQSNAYVLGEKVVEFEEKYARYSNVKYCAGVANGTDAIEILLRATGLPKNSKVLLPANTFAATAFAVLRAGFRIVLTDIDQETMLMDINSLTPEKIHECDVVLPVHLYGQMVDIENLLNRIEKSKYIIEDAAQSQGAKWNGKTAGQLTFGAATSFYPGKNLGAFGDAGGILTESEETIAKVRAIRNYGSTIRYEHLQLGFNSRLDSLQAHVLIEKLKHLEDWNNQRKEIAERYLLRLDGIKELKLPVKSANAHHVWHLFVVRVADRKKFMGYLLSRGVETSIHYPTPIHLHKAFESLGYVSGNFPFAEESASQCVSLPLFPGMTENEQEYVIDCVQDFFRAQGI